MVIELRPYSGPGIRPPKLIDDSWRQSSFFDEPNLKRVLDAPYYEDFIRQQTGPDALGTIEGGPTFSQAMDILHPDPRKWTTIEAPRSMSTPILGDLGAAPSRDAASKLGRFNLNLIDPFDSLREGVVEGAGVEEPAQQYQPLSIDIPDTVFGDIHTTPMDVLNWTNETPVKLIERPLAFLQVAASRILGQPVPIDDEGQAAYPFQKDPAYWAWLQSATDEQVTQFARAQAGQYVSSGRNAALFDALLSRFQQDRDSLTGLSSGSQEIDWHAKVAAWNEAGGVSIYGGAANYRTNQLGANVGTWIGSVPFVGINLQSWADPITPEMDAHWASLPVAERQRLLEQQGYVLVAKNLIGMIPTFNGAAALGAAAKASSVPTVVKMAEGWSTTLKAANVLMATGIAISTAAWAAEMWAPREWADFGRDVNMAAPLSSDANAAFILANVGGFASGTFGAALLGRATAAGARGLAGRSPGLPNLSARLWGTPELPTFQAVGGSEFRTLLHEAAGVEENIADVAVQQLTISYLVNASDADLLAVNKALRDGSGVPELENLPPGEAEAWAARSIERLYSSRGVRVSMMLDRLDRLRRSLPLLPGSDDIAIEAATKLGVRKVMDDAARQIEQQYGPTFFGADRAAIRGRVEQGLREIGYTPDMAKLDAKLGTRDNPPTVNSWLKMARFVHQLGYVTENGRLRAAIDQHPGSAETGLALFSQRTPFADEMAAAIDILRGPDQAAAREYARALIAQKLRLDELYALGQFRDAKALVADPDPIALAGHLQDVLEHGGFPERRLQATDPATADLPLNRFHRDLAGRGKWELGYRAKRSFESRLSYAASLERELSAFEFTQLEPMRLTIVDVPPEGYIELLPGQRFKRKNWYALKLIQTSDGRIFALDDGSLQSAAQASPAPTTPTRPTNDPGNPQPFDPYRGKAEADAFSQLPTLQQILVRDVTASGGNFTAAPPAFALQDTGIVKRGRNAGATWPVLEEALTGTRWLFKARRTGGDELADLSPARRLAGPVATKLFKYFGLNTAEEIPFKWGDTKGTIQRLLDPVEVVDLDRLPKYSAATHAELVKHHIVDWLTGQHDSNSDSFFIEADGNVYGIDKGQAYKYFAEPEPSAALHGADEYFDFRTRDAADTHLGEYLLSAIRDGELEAHWEDIEPLLQQIQDLPEDVYLAALKPLAEARVADGRFETTVEQFYAAAIERKRIIGRATRNAFARHGFAVLHPDTPPSFEPGAIGRIDLGGPVRLNEPPIPLGELLVRTEQNPIPEPELSPTKDHYKAGVVIQEADGRVWVIAPKGGFGGYSHTWPKGKVSNIAADASIEIVGSEFQTAAVREAFEETGLSVVLKEHLADLPNDEGNVTRYYLAERVAGGPAYVATPDEVGLVRLMTTDEAAANLYRNGAPDARDQAVLDALRQRREANQAEAAGPAAPVDADLPGSEVGPEPAEEFGYVGHVKLRNGEVWQTPWLDPSVLDAGAIELGNRGLLGRAYDGVFHGWRAWRQMEQQKLNMHHRFTRDYEITPAQVERFHTDLLALSRKYRGVSMQGLAGNFEATPFLGKATHDVRALAAEIFGEGPFLNRRTGRLDDINFPREVTRAYRQAIRLNVLSGVTSHVKAIPGIGGLIIPVTDILYPMLRYTLSFIFKPSERTESGLLNAMRGVQYSGDPFIDAQYARAGLGAGTGVLAEEAGYDLILQGMTSFSPTLGQRGRFGQDPFFYEMPDPAALAKRVANEIAPREPLPPGGSRSTLRDSLDGGPLELADPDRFPDVYPDQLRHLLKQVGVDDAGNPILQTSGGEQTLAQVKAKRDQLLGEILNSSFNDPDVAERLGAGFEVLRALPPGAIERLAEAMPLVHTPVVRQGGDVVGRQLGFLQEAIDAGNPLFAGLMSSGKYDMALYKTLTGGTVMTAEQASRSVSETSISAGEQWVGFADAKYGSMGGVYNAGIGSQGILPIIKPEAMRESVTLDTDRINYSNNAVAIGDAMMTPAAVNGITRLVVQRMILDWAAGHSNKTLLEFMQTETGAYFGAIEPFEFAYLQGIGAEQIASMMVPADKLASWTEFVKRNPDAGLEDIPVVPYDGNASSDAWRGPMFANALERAGLLDLAKSKPADLADVTPGEGILALPMELLEDVVASGGSEWLTGRIIDQGITAGLHAEVEYSLLDRVRISANEERLTERRHEASRKAQELTPSDKSGYGYGGYNVFDPAAAAAATGKRTALEQLATDIAAWNEGAGAEFDRAAATELAAIGGTGDPSLAARAEAWLLQEAEFQERYRAIEGPMVSPTTNGRATSRVTVTEAGYADRPLLERDIEGADVQPRMVKGVTTSSDAPWQAARAKAILEVHQALQPTGWKLKSEGYLSKWSTRAILEQVDSPELRAALRGRAKAKLGIDVGDPVIRAYIRGPGHRLAPVYGGARAGVDELVIVVQDGSGQPYGGLSLPELNDLWQQHGFAAKFRDAAQATGYDPEMAGQLADPAGDDAGVLLHGPGATPEGRGHFYLPSHGAVKRINGTWQESPLGKDYIDTGADAAFDISFAHHFEPGRKSYIDLETGRALYRDDILIQEDAGATIIHRQDRGGNREWEVRVEALAGDVREATLDEASTWSKRPGQAWMEAIRELIAWGQNESPGPVRLKLETDTARNAFDRLAARGELPDWLVGVERRMRSDPTVRDEMTGEILHQGSPAVEEWVARDTPRMVADLNPAAAAAGLEPPPTSFDQVTPEGRLTERIADHLASLKTRAGKTAHAWFVDPIPAKQRAMDRLTFKLIRERFSPLLREEAPEVAAVFDELGIPEPRRLDFLIHDRALLDEWLRTGAREDWVKLLEHGDRYGGTAAAAETRQALHELYTSPAFDEVLETLRLAMKAAQDEAYTVHFFSPYRSTLERSINHPLLGIYPASWAYKAAKEWIRFLYRNETLGFRLGMTPAMAIKQIADAQAKSFAMQGDQSLEDWYEKGPYRNSIFIFNLLMPGDWSSLPFPASRTIRDALRGNVNLYDIFERNIASIGAGRDIRLTLGAGDELLKTVTGEIGNGPMFRKAGVERGPGWSLSGDDAIPVPGAREAPRDVFTWR